MHDASRKTIDPVYFEVILKELQTTRKGKPQCEVLSLAHDVDTQTQVMEEGRQDARRAIWPENLLGDFVSCLISDSRSLKYASALVQRPRIAWERRNVDDG